MTAGGMRLRSVFLAGCIALALPGLVASGFHAVQARAAWRAAQAAARGARAASEAMRAATLVMVERGHVQGAAFDADSEARALIQAGAASDAALARTERALRDAGLPTAAVEQAREGIAAARGRAERAGRKRAALRAPIEHYNRLVEGLEDELSRIERAITLADPSVGIAVGLARNANELRGIAGRRGVLLNAWSGGEDLAPAQKDELLALNGRLAGAWERLQRGVRGAGLGGASAEAVASAEDEFFARREPWYRELVKAAAAGDERPLDHARYRAWSVAALERLLPLRDALVAEASAQGAAAIGAARRGLLACAGVASVSLALVAAAVLALLRGLVEPVRDMTAAMTALAAGDLAAEAPGRGGPREIAAMAAAVAVFRDNVASLHRREAELRRANLRFEAALANMNQGLCQYDAGDRLRVFNERFCAIFGLDRGRVRPGLSFAEVVRMSVAAGNHPGCTAEAIVSERATWRRRAEPDSVLLDLAGGRVVSVSSRPMADGGWVATYEDVTERRRSEERLAHMARHDALTGLPNRVRLREHMEGVLPRLRRGGGAAVLCLDLDGFKGVNDTLGHPAGDELLRAVAGRLRGAAREADLVARLGGDEFAVVQADVERPADAAALADRLVAVLREPFELRDQRVEIGASIGVALAGEAACDPDELLRNADIALYRAKAAGRGVWRLFEAGMDAELRRRRDLEASLRRALVHGQFEVHYQPLVRAGTRATTGFEALLRWRHPERGLVGPGEFIPLAEEIGLIRAMGAWVLMRA